MSRSGVLRIIRAGLLAATLLAAACDLNPAEPVPSQPPPQVIITGGAPASPTPAVLAIWILWPLGVNVHQSPGTTAPVAGTAEQSAELNVEGSRRLGAQRWLQVSASDQSGLKGWVLDDPGLVIHQAVSLEINSEQAWSMVFPSAWTVTPASNPTGATTLSGDGATMTVDVEAPTPKTSPPGALLQDQQIEVYGKTTVLATYRLADGGYEFVTGVKWDAQRYFTISYREPAAAQPDPALCLQLITGIKID
jgi:hypothetical protein